MKNNEFLWICSFLAVSTFVLSLPARGAQDQPLEITDVNYKSEDGTVVSKLYRLKDLRGRAPAILVLPGRGRDFSGMEWLIKPLAQSGYAVLAIGYRGVPPSATTSQTLRMPEMASPISKGLPMWIPLGLGSLAIRAAGWQLL
jgi:hypothetical protein